ncbi:DUF4292 domain-containing protein [bacterium]|nr:DUF4292 domain-containing protein [bacterium]
MFSILFVGCAAQHRVVEFAKVDIEPDALIDTLLAHDAALEAIVGRMSIHFEGETLEASFTADYFFAAPDSFRANIRGLLGSVPGAALSIGDSLAVFCPSKGTLYVARGDTGIHPIMGLRIGMSDIVSALTGRTGIDLNRDSLAGFSSEGSSYELLFSDGHEFRRFSILPSAWVLNNIQVFSQDGSAILDIGYYDFVERDGLIRANKITITNPIRNERVEIEIEKEAIGHKLPRRIFELPIPPETAIWRMD